jgi:hypothetical protein
VGVVGDIRRGGLNAEPYPQVFVDYRQATDSGNVDYWWTFFAVRTSRPDIVLDSVPAIVRRFDRDARIDRFAPLAEVVADSIAAPRLIGWICSAIAVAGIALAAIGLYGVMSYLAVQRTGEVGVRMALGADRRLILSMILRYSAVVALGGIVLGVALSLATTRYLRSMLFGIDPIDGPTFVAVALIFFAVTMLAAWVPARRSTRISPLTALRHD